MASTLTYRLLARTLHHVPRRRALQWAPSRCQQRSVATYTSPRQAAQISVLQTAVDTNSNTYKENAASMSELMRRLTFLHEEASKGGPEKARAKHVARGKMLVRECV